MCDKSIKLEAKRRHLQLLTDEELDIFLDIKHSIKSADIFSIDKKLNDLNLAKFDCKIVFDSEL